MKFKNPKLNELAENISYISRIISDDCIGVYAAQASFFVIISAVPFLSLMIAVLSLFIPQNVGALLNAFPLPESLTGLVGSVLTELRNMPNISLLSISALAALWASSKGVGATRGGVEKVYKVKIRKNYFRRKFQSLISTLFFIVLIIAVVLLLIFGDFIAGFLQGFKLTDIVMSFRLPFFALFTVLVFTVMYMTMSRGSSIFKLKPWQHLPGAAFAALGWIVFSWGYSLYLSYFPGSVSLYGGLAAVCLMMLWLYFCMTILLLGAELNVLFFTCCQRKK